MCKKNSDLNCDVNFEHFRLIFSPKVDYRMYDSLENPQISHEKIREIFLSFPLCPIVFAGLLESSEQYMIINNRWMLFLRAYDGANSANST